MAEQDGSLKHHGDPLEDVVEGTVENNRAQRQSDSAPADVMEGDTPSDRADGRGSDANGIPAFDEADGGRRKSLYKETGATIVSRID